MKPYGKENYQTDVDWLIGQGVDEAEVGEFINSLLNSEWVKRKNE